MHEYKSCEEFRKALLCSIEERRSVRSQDIDDPFWSSGLFGGGYNAARWSVRGGSAAIDLLEETVPLPDETVEQYADRLEEKLKVLKNEFYSDPDDEDGFATGAVVDAIFMLQKLRE